MTLTRPWPFEAGEPSDPDGPLLAKAMQGDRTAFDALRRRHERTLLGFVTRRVGRDAADDLTQDVWLACWASLPRYRARSRFKAWLYGIAAHKCTDHFRARAQHALREQAAIGIGAGAADHYGAADLRHTVHEALAQLPDVQREVLELYYYAELTLAEIAGALGRNPNTVKYQFYRGHAQVAQELQAEGRATR